MDRIPLSDEYEYSDVVWDDRDEEDEEWVEDEHEFDPYDPDTWPEDEDELKGEYDRHTR